jgi:hypothetical protein
VLRVVYLFAICEAKNDACDAKFFPRRQECRAQCDFFFVAIDVMAFLAEQCRHNQSGVKTCVDDALRDRTSHRGQKCHVPRPKVQNNVTLPRNYLWDLAHRGKSDSS